jgi:hypothetical protein
MEMNFMILAVAALVPLLVGFVWYHPKLFGTAWMSAAKLTEDDTRGFNMVKVFSLTYVLSFLAAMLVQSMVIHQYAIYSLLLNEPGFGEPGSEVMLFIDSVMEKYGNNFRTFGHGAIHGVITGIFFIMPVLAINAMFERKGFKYIAINTGFWTVSLVLMGGIICAFA